MSVTERGIVIEDDDLAPRAPAQSIRRSVSLPFSPRKMIGQLSRTPVPYDQIPPKPLRLTVLKLDGSTFGIEVMKTGTVADLKQAVEAAFGHMPKKGPGKISWPHVWSHFCLCYGDWKLVMDSDYIGDYGIKDGDQLRFIRYISTSYNPVQKRSKKKVPASKQPNAKLKDKKTKEADDDLGTEEKKHEHCHERNSSIKHRPLELVRGLKGFMSLPTTGRRPGAKFLHLQTTCRLLRRYRKMLQICRNKHDIQIEAQRRLVIR